MIKMNKEGKITLESLQTVDISKLDSNAKDLYLGIIQLINERDIANKKLNKIKELVNKYGYYTLSEIPELLSIIGGKKE
jgi:uncharacterized protein YcgL (UPF0745 family)